MMQAPARLPAAVHRGAAELTEGVSGILLPGERDFLIEKTRRAKGIMTTTELEPRLQEAARRTGVEVPI